MRKRLALSVGAGKLVSWLCLALLSLWLSDQNCVSTLVSGLGTQPPRASRAKDILELLCLCHVRQFLIINFIVNKYTAVLWRILTNTYPYSTCPCYVILIVKVPVFTVLISKRLDHKGAPCTTDRTAFHNGHCGSHGLRIHYKEG